MQYILPSLAGMVNGIGASQGREANGLELIIGFIKGKRGLKFFKKLISGNKICLAQKLN